MKAFKSYFTPDQAAGKPATESSNPDSIQPVKPVPKPLANKPAPYRNYSTRTSARQSTVSLALTAGMRDKHASSIIDFRSDMTVHSLYQDQLRKMYASAWNLGEGVVLKKGRNDYACAPPQLSTIPNGFYDMVSQLNVSVSGARTLRLYAILTKLVCHDCQHPCNSVHHSRHHECFGAYGLYPSFRRVAATGSSENDGFAPMPEASFRGLRS